jgi:hypothetical protein
VAQLDPLAVELVELLVEHLVQDEQQAVHLFARAAPVLGGEGVDGQVGDAELDAGGYDAAQVFDAGMVAGHARQAAGDGPAAIAVHDEGHMDRNFRQNRVGLGGGHPRFP